MKKNLLTVSALLLAVTANAQFLSYVGDKAQVYVSKDALVYNGGGMTMVGSGLVENHGNIMVVGSSSDKFLTVDTDGVTDKKEKSTVTNFINKLNEPDAYPSVNTASSPSVYTYGQLYITGLVQDNVKGIVDQEYRQVPHGDYQQLAVPFYNKTFSVYSSEFNKTFDNKRWYKNEILVWNNTKAQFDNVDVASMSSKATSYYIFGAQNLNPAKSSPYNVLKGRPYAEDKIPSVVLQDGGKDANLQAGGTHVNSYNERYNSYLQDGFHTGSGGTAWTGNYGKNIYQFSNPFLTNIDLKNIGGPESAATGDGVNLSNIYGIRFEVSGVQYDRSSGGGSTSYKFVTFVSQNSNGGSSLSPAGDVDYLVVRPMGTFVVKLNDSNTTPTLNFLNLRRFAYIPRGGSVNYTVDAAKITKGSETVLNANAVINQTANSAAGSSLKQLGVIGLDSNGNEVGRTYYIVYADAVNGHPEGYTAQVQSGSDITTFEEEPTKGGYDQNYLGYSLYINEANENTFKGKPIPLAIYSQKIKSLKFEIRENADLLKSSESALSSGESFYYKLDGGNIMKIAQGQEVPVSIAADGSDALLYYGTPIGTLATDASVKVPSQTRVVFDPSVDNYIVRFDPKWKKAEVQVYDMSGKLVISKNNINASADFSIILPKDNRVYMVSAKSESGDKMTTKIIR